MNINLERLNKTLEIVSEAQPDDLVPIEGFLILLNVSDDVWAKILDKTLTEDEMLDAFDETNTRLESAGIEFKSEK